MIVSHIVAVAENDVIGVEGHLPWDLPEDMKFFKEKTKGHSMIMGRKTYESIGKPLPKRLNIIVTRQPNYIVEGAIVVKSIEEGLNACKEHLNEYGEEVFIIGGGEIYRQSMDIADILYVTRIHKSIEGDAKYPKVDMKSFEEIERRERTDPVPFSFLTYKRRSMIPT